MGLNSTDLNLTYTIPTLAERFNCYLPSCNITELAYDMGVRPVYITYNIDFSYGITGLNIMLFILNIALLLYGDVLLNKMRSLWFNIARRKNVH